MRERRVSSRHCLDRALSSWLNAVAARAHLSDVLVSDSTGLLVATTEQCPCPSDLAALAAQRHHDIDHDTHTTDDAGRSLTIRTLFWRNHPLLVCAVGEADRARPCLDDAVTGIARILG